MLQEVYELSLGLQVCEPALRPKVYEQHLHSGYLEHEGHQGAASPPALATVPTVPTVMLLLVLGAPAA